MSQEYKNTSNGVIPSKWDILRIADFANVGSSKRIMRSEYTETGVPFYRSKEIIDAYLKRKTTDSYHISVERFNEIDTKFGSPQKGDLLITAVGTLGVPYIVGEEKFYFKDGNLLWLRDLSDEVNSEYLYYYIQGDAFKSIIGSNTGGSSQSALTIEKLKNMTIAKPPLLEQQKISMILSTVDEHINEVDGMIDDLKELKKGLMQKLLTEGVGHTEFKDSAVGRVPVEWEVVRLDSIGSFYKGKGISRNEVKTSGYPCIRYGEIYTTYNYQTVKTVSFVDDESALKSVPIVKGDLIFAGSGETVEDIGKAISYLGEKECFVGGDTIIMHPNHRVDSIYLSYYLSTEQVKAQTRRLGQGSSVIHIYTDGIKSIEIALPSKEEQLRIGNIFSQIDERRELLTKEKNDLNEMKKGLMQKLLTGKIRVKISS